MSGFKKFLLRGNVVDMAVGVIIGVAFAGVINALVKDLITPIVAAIGGQPDFSAIAFSLNGSKFAIGDFLNALTSFVIIAAVVYFLVVLPVNSLVARFKQEPPSDPTTKECAECASTIPIKAKRCAFCTSLQ